MLVIPSQARGALARYAVSREEAARSAWIIDSDGRRHEGAEAVNAVLQELGGGAAALGRVLSLRPLTLVEGAAYGWFARHRSGFSRFGTRPECEEAGSDCE